MSEAPPRFVSGFVSILGRPNAGKSTLLNALVGTKLAIVADKPQTTRTTIQGVLTLPEGQIIFIDTPGIHRPDSPFNKRMMETVRAALAERDLLLFLVDATLPLTEAGRQAVDLIRKAGAPALLVLNKIDLLGDKSRLLPLIEAYRGIHEFAEYLPLSALNGDGLDELRAAILARLPEGPQYFPEDHLTDQPERFLAAELIREKIIRETRQEVPHCVAVIVDRWEETARVTRVLASVIVEKEGHKGIVIGPKGAMLKKVGTLAREEMELVFGRRFFLELYVKVQPKWRENPAFLNALNWRTMAGTDETQNHSGDHTDPFPGGAVARRPEERRRALRPDPPPADQRPRGEGRAPSGRSQAGRGDSARHRGARQAEGTGREGGQEGEGGQGRGE